MQQKQRNNKNLNYKLEETKCSHTLLEAHVFGALEIFSKVWGCSTFFELFPTTFIAVERASLFFIFLLLKFQVQKLKETFPNISAEDGIRNSSSYSMSRNMQTILPQIEMNLPEVCESVHVSIWSMVVFVFLSIQYLFCLTTQGPYIPFCKCYEKPPQYFA